MTLYPAEPEGLHIVRDGAVLRLCLDRPERRNALTDDIVLALIEAIDAAGSDDDVRVLELTAAGDHFCSGFDLAARSGEKGERPRVGSVHRRMHSHINRLVPVMLTTQTPIVAVVRGWAIGLGLNLALAADFAVVATDARLWASFTTMGFTPDSGASWLIPRLVGVARAREMLLLGRQVSGDDAARWGLVHQAVAPDDLAAAAAGLVGELAAGPTVAIGLTKLLMHRGLTADLERHLADEGFAMEVSSRSEDFAEHGRARRDKRDPDFRGR